MPLLVHARRKSLRWLCVSNPSGSAAAEACSLSARTRRGSRNAPASCLATDQPHLPWCGVRRMRLTHGGSLSVATLSPPDFAATRPRRQCRGVRTNRAHRAALVCRPRHQCLGVRRSAAHPCSAKDRLVLPCTGVRAVRLHTQCARRNLRTHPAFPGKVVSSDWNDAAESRNEAGGGHE